MNHLQYLIAIVFCLTLGLPAEGSEPRATQPKLVVVIVIDQLRGDLVTRFEHEFRDDGFRRLEREGALFVNAHYSYGSSETAPGHATIGTGRLPRQHGVVANKWYFDAANKSGVHAVTDVDVRQIPAKPDVNAPGASPRHLIGPGFGDQLKVSDRRSRVFAVALKDRAAIFTSGKRPDGAYWWDGTTGNFVTSTWYRDKLPGYIEAFNAAKPCEKLAGSKWNLALDPFAYEGCHPVEPQWHDYLGLGAAFPHALPPFDAANPRAYLSALYCTPFGNDLVIDMAEAILRNEKLGSGPAADMLCIGLSSNDLVGHYFGPDSIEMKDMTIHTDRQLARLFGILEESVGMKDCVIALTGDHGCTSTPLLTQKLRLGGGVLDLPKVQARLDDQLQGFFPTPDHGQPPHTIVINLDLPWIYLNQALLATLPDDKRREALRRAVEVLRGFEGVNDVIMADDLAGPMPSPAETTRYLAWRCYHPQRSGQLFVQLAPFWYKTDDKISGHDGGSNHDRHVPIYLFGPRIKPGRYFAEADPCDIATTLASLLGIEPPLDASGRVLHEAMDSRP
ncbi:MAG: alkaline phosphatase family protein [Planctomycetes bacterium]|nr:alkaline phosphatase family protein [Planctomycetota bacterium]